jgi:peptide-methionine (R)-S-oxide reductase
MNRRQFLNGAVVAIAASAAPSVFGADAPAFMGKVVKTDAEWRAILTPAQFNILREEGTERPFSSPLNEEKRKGTFVCAGCALALFDSSTKFESGTGWPSFYDVVKGRVETKVDHKLIYPRTEYHCARCGGHQGHVFDDGPKPTGLRYCNNGLALKFIAA